MNDSCILNVNIMFLGLFFCFLILSIGDLNLSDGFSYHLHMDDESNHFFPSSLPQPCTLVS